MQTPLPNLIRELDDSLRFGPFLLRFRLRNPRTGPGGGCRGVASDKLVKIYGSTFKTLWNHFRAAPHQRPLPRKVIEVYILDIFDTVHGVPFMATEKGGQPYIVLPCRIPSGDPHSEFLYATACALHEGSHALCEAQRHYASYDSILFWRWFNEATAVWAEMLLSAGNPNTMEYFLGWCDHPEKSLATDPYWYGASLFVRYLQEELGEKFISRVWVEGVVDKTPMDAIGRLGRPGLFHDYSVASYFTRSYDGKETIFAAPLRRFSGRAVVHSYDLAPGEVRPLTASLEKLSTHYYRLYPVSGATALTVSGGGISKELGASLALATADGRRVDPGPPAGTQEIALLPDTDHVVLIVSNESCIDGLTATFKIRASRR